jgi:WD40 repeat protein
VPSSISSDGNLLLIGPSTSKLAFDLRTRTPIKIGGPLKSDIDMVYAFQGNEKVLGVNAGNMAKSGIFSFPDGKSLQQIKLNLSSAATVAHGDYFLVPGPKGFVSAVGDVNATKYVAVSKVAALDIFDDTVATEEGDGTLLTYKAPLKDPSQLAHLALPLSPLGPPRAVALSPDGRFLALSAHNRGGVWDLSTGKETYLMRGFSVAVFTPDAKLLLEFPGVKDSDTFLHQIALADPAVKSFANLDYKLADSQHLESGRILEWKLEKKVYSLIAHSPQDNSVQWTRIFPDEQPGYTINQADNDLIFSYPIQSNPGKEKLKSDATLKTQAAQVKFKDAGRIIEIADPSNGKTRTQVVVEVPVTYPGVDGFTRLGDQLYLSADDNRTIVYSLQTGAQLRQVFGVVVATDIPSERIATINRRDELVVYDRAGVELQHLKLGSPVRFAALKNKGTQLIVLTADQKVRRFNIDPKPQLSAAN